MPRVDRDEVAALAHLARLDLATGDHERLASELGAILDHVAMLGELDVTGVEPMTHAVAIAPPLRADVPAPPLPVAVALAGAAVHRDDCFEVPAVIES